MQRVIQAADELIFGMPWQNGDVALVDNFMAMHGRRPFTGTRKVLAFCGRREMPWKKCNGMDARLKFVAWLLEGEKMAPLCLEFSISRKTGYKIFDYYKECGLHLTAHRRSPILVGAPLRTITSPIV